MSRPALWTAGLIALAVLLPGASGAGEKATVPDLSGTWKLNDEVTWRMLQNMRQREHGPGPGRGGPMGRPGGGGPRGGGGEGQPPGGGPGRPGGRGGQSLAEGSEELVLLMPVGADDHDLTGDTVVP